jgi:hypothetical protein
MCSTKALIFHMSIPLDINFLLVPKLLTLVLDWSLWTLLWPIKYINLGHKFRMINTRAIPDYFLWPFRYFQTFDLLTLVLASSIKTLSLTITVNRFVLHVHVTCTDLRLIVHIWILLVPRPFCWYQNISSYNRNIYLQMISAWNIDISSGNFMWPDFLIFDLATFHCTC